VDASLLTYYERPEVFVKGSARLGHLYGYALVHSRSPQPVPVAGNLSSFPLSRLAALRF